MIKNYLKIAIKVLFRRKLYTIITLTGISITLMIVMLTTSFWQHMQSNSKPQTQFDKVSTLIILKSVIYNEKGDKGIKVTPPSHYFIEKYVKTMKTPVKVSSFSPLPIYFDYYKDNNKAELSLKNTDFEFFEICDFHFIEGRPYNKIEYEEKEMLIVIDKSTADLISPNESSIGKKLQVFSKTYKVVGVVDNVDVSQLMIASNIYIPISTNSAYDRKRNYNVQSSAALILANSTSDLNKINEEFQTVLTKVENLDPEAHRFKITAKTQTGIAFMIGLILDMSENKISNIITALVAIISLFFLILPATNLININISRIYERSSEIGVRKSFGAHSGSIASQFIIENIFITLLGGILSIFLTLLAMYFINISDIIPHFKLQIYPISLFYSFLVTLLFGFMSGVIPAWRMSRLKISETLKAS